ncbi:VOC family protein [Pseudonocardia lacus]|uniref:VOC family protein n=1 Tax=Pseudonocardia lacus TaxID=2835865 RepID=UPI001BDCE858|nr:VOC family protein [Pseudonocardia lacus]
MSTTPSNGIAGLAAIAVDCSDPPALADFWQRLLGGSAEDDADGNTMLTGGLVDVIFMRVLEPKAAKNRLHLDLRAADQDTAVASALDAGATKADDVYRGPRWQVLRDPEGNEFCILPPRP